MLYAYFKLFPVKKKANIGIFKWKFDVKQSGNVFIISFAILNSLFSEILSLFSIGLIPVENLQIYESINFKLIIYLTNRIKILFTP